MFKIYIFYAILLLYFPADAPTPNLSENYPKSPANFYNFPRALFCVGRFCNASSPELMELQKSCCISVFQYFIIVSLQLWHAKDWPSVRKYSAVLWECGIINIRFFFCHLSDQSRKLSFIWLVFDDFFGNHGMLHLKCFFSSAEVLQ